jgi:predicted transcriptional regulator
MSNLTELATQIIAARAAKKDMSKEEFQEEMQMVYSFLKGVEDGSVQPAVQEPAAETKPLKINLKQYFKKDEVVCAICNKGFKTLKRHLSIAHSLKPGEYRKQFGIPTSQGLAAKSYVESRRQMAIDKGLGEGLAKARAKKKADAEKKKASLPVVKVAAPVPAVKKKAALPAKVETAKAPAKAVKPAVVKTAAKSGKK